MARCRVLVEAARERGAEIAEGGPVDWLVVDNYATDAAAESAARSQAGRILAIDDLGRRHDCDVLLDQNWFPDPWKRYDGKLPARCRRLLGPHYALLRPEFSRAEKRARDGTVHTILVSFGGGDATNETAKAIETISSLKRPVDADIVVGPANPHGLEIEKLCAGNPRFRVHKAADNMAELMQRADLAMGAGGSTTWERCCMGLPALQFVVAPNQEAPTRALAEAGFVFYKKELKEVVEQSAELARQSRAIMRLVDGEGRRRVAAALFAGPGTRFTLRDAKRADAELYFAWANDPEVRQQSFRSEPIAWEEHVAWFAARLADGTLLLVAEDEAGVPLGQARFEQDAGRWRIHYSVAPEFRGVGLGAKMLAAAIAELRRRRAGARLTALVKVGNMASHRVFAALGFAKRSDTMYELDS